MSKLVGGDLFHNRPRRKAGASRPGDKIIQAGGGSPQSDFRQLSLKVILQNRLRGHHRSPIDE
jgi:hypothetical protein